MSFNITRLYTDVLYTRPAVRIFNENVSHTLDLSQEVLSGVNHMEYDETISHTLQFHQTATVNYVYIENVSHTLSISQPFYVGQNYDENVSHNLSIDSDNTSSNLKRYFINQHLTLTSGIIEAGPINEEVISSLELDQTVQSNTDYNCSVSHTLTLHSSFTYYVESSLYLKQYHPFVGSGTDHPPLILSEPLAGIVVPFQFVWPSIGTVTDSVMLRSPEFGNKDRLTFNRINRETRGGTLIIFANTIWPKIQTLSLTFTGLRKIVVDDLFNFLHDHLGVEIGLIDWESRYWRGVITTPDNPITEDSFDNYTVNLEFEGEMDSTWIPQIINAPSGLPCRARS